MIDDYLLDRMPNVERLAFEKEVETDSELKEQLEFTKSLQQAMKSRSEKLALMKEWESAYEWQYDLDVAQTRAAGSGYESCSVPSTDDNRFEKKSSRIRILYWVTGMAAMFVAGFFILNKPNMGDDNWNNITFPTVNGGFRGSSDYSGIKLLMEQNDYKEALSLIDEEMKLLDKDSYQVSIKELRDELMWLKVQALVGLKRKKDAVSTLEKLRNSDGLYKNVADSIYLLIR